MACNEQINSELYFEIYKLHLDKITNASNRRVDVNKYYILALSILILVLSAVMRGGDVLFGVVNGTPDKSILDNNLIGVVIMTIGMLGSMLSSSWMKDISSYLYSNSNRYEVIKGMESMENRLPYNFTEEIWKLIDRESHIHQLKRDKQGEISYWDLSFHGLYAPSIFGLGFILLMTFGAWLILNKDVYISYAVSTLSCVFFIYKLGSKLRRLKFRSYISNNDNEVNKL